MTTTITDRTVYVIDPDEAVGEALAAFLDIYGFAVRLYAGVEDFVDANSLDELAGGCLLIDIDRSIQTVLTFLHRIGNRQPGFPVFLMTSLGSTEAGGALRDAPINGIIKKPFIHGVLIEQLSHLFPVEMPA
ncbi:MAG: hypothetical protein KDJ38_09735 [Gammaproteobacteria bacterium]|nr:hypothetical protein [Gammaproteobacteria bacterium]